MQIDIDEIQIASYCLLLIKLMSAYCMHQRFMFVVYVIAINLLGKVICIH